MSTVTRALAVTAVALGTIAGLTACGDPDDDPVVTVSPSVTPTATPETPVPAPSSSAPLPSPPLPSLPTDKTSPPFKTIPPQN